MTSAAEYARVFRAAADGVLSGVTMGQTGLQDLIARYSMYGLTREMAVSTAFQGQKGALMTFGAFDGVASMFEKIAEAEAALNSDNSPAARLRRIVEDGAVSNGEAETMLGSVNRLV